jgi:hypothetical protein
LLRSKICVSPFGYGEICWRDFEAVCLGCLLIKPDMGHVRTAPDLFIPGVTYAPVRWDFSDLEEVCSHYLENEKERVQIAQRARETLLNALRPEWFADRFGDLLTKLGLVAPRLSASA